MCVCVCVCVCSILLKIVKETKATSASIYNIICGSLHV